jgi:glycosyltransferase involved in cell wall biosynthesis
VAYTSSGRSEQTADVSILLLTYNRAKFLPDTFDAIIRQTYSNYELLICDDGSSDDTKGGCEEYVARDSRFRYLRNEHNLGQFENLNLRLPQARCELVATLHDGDIYHPTLIEKWRAALLKYPSAGFVFNQYRHLDASGRAWCVTTPFPEIMKGSDFLLRCFADRDLYYPPWGTLMARKSVYEAVNYFNTRYNMCSRCGTTQKGGITAISH